MILIVYYWYSQWCPQPVGHWVCLLYHFWRHFKWPPWEHPKKWKTTILFIHLLTISLIESLYWACHKNPKWDRNKLSPCKVLLDNNDWWKNGIQNLRQCTKWVLFFIGHCCHNSEGCNLSDENHSNRYLTVVGRLNFKKKSTFFLQNLHMTTISCVECQEFIKKLITAL